MLALVILVKNTFHQQRHNKPHTRARMRIPYAVMIIYLYCNEHRENVKHISRENTEIQIVTIGNTCSLL